MNEKKWGQKKERKVKEFLRRKRVGEKKRVKTRGKNKVGRICMTGKENKSGPVA